MKPVQIRGLEPGDAEAITLLSAQLGYPCAASEIRARIERLAGFSERLLIGAVFEDHLVGWAEASTDRHLQSPDVVLLGGLVVGESERGQGVGRQLCGAVEAWARSLGVATVRVRSQVKRDDAHRFYLREGFRHVKTSMVFEKKLF